MENNNEIRTDYRRKKNENINLVVVILISVLGFIAALGFAGIYKMLLGIDIADAWYLSFLIPIALLQYIGFRNNRLDEKKRIFDIEEEEIDLKKRDYVKISIKLCWLLLAILLMASAQAILSFTPQIGMAPIDSFIQALAYATGGEYALMNYLVIFGLILGAIVFAAPKNKIMATTSFITGYSLAFLVHFFINNVFLHFPGLELVGGNGGTSSVWVGILYFVSGFMLLTISVGIWVNVGFGLRPYDSLLITMESRFSPSYVFFRNVFDTTWASFAILFTIIAILAQGMTLFGDNSALSVGVGSLLFIFGAGHVSAFFRRVFSKII